MDCYSFVTFPLIATTCKVVSIGNSTRQNLGGRETGNFLVLRKAETLNRMTMVGTCRGNGLALRRAVLLTGRHGIGDRVPITRRVGFSGSSLVAVVADTR